MFDDTICGSNNTPQPRPSPAMAGNDYIDGRGGFDVASYNNIYLSTGGITVNMAAGIVDRRCLDRHRHAALDRRHPGHRQRRHLRRDRLRRWPARSTSATTAPSTSSKASAATTSSPATATPASSTPMRRPRSRSTCRSAPPTAPRRATSAAIGTDTFTGGVNSVTGSAFGDTLIGDGNSNTFVGGGGNDAIDGGGRRRHRDLLRNRDPVHHHDQRQPARSRWPTPSPAATAPTR